MPRVQRTCWSRASGNPVVPSVGCGAASGDCIWCPLHLAGLLVATHNLTRRVMALVALTVGVGAAGGGIR